MSKVEDDIAKIANVLEKLYEFISIRDSRNDPVTGDGNAYRHQLHYGGYLIEKVIEGKLVMFYEDEEQRIRVQLRHK